MAEIYMADKKVELERFLNLVVEAILQENTSLFLGAGSSMQYNAPNWNNLINNIHNGYTSGNNIEKAQHAEFKGIDIKTEISKQISCLNIDYEKENTYLNYLLDFDYKSIWTTNYDQIIEEILKKKKKPYLSIYKYCHFQKLSYPGGGFLFKINGSYNDAKTIVITKEDFMNYRKSHEAYLILLKRELLCHNFLFLGCSFEDDILRICIKDILNCIQNSSDNYITNHFAIIAEKNEEKLEFISKDLSRHYNIKCLNVKSVEQAYRISYGISYKAKFSTVFISGAKKYERHSDDEEIGKLFCQKLITAFMKYEEFPFKFISGMGMSIGHFICGTVKQKCKGKNQNRYLQMEPFPFTSKEDNDIHRENIMNKAGVFIFIFGDYNECPGNIEKSGMWREYLQAKRDIQNIIIPLPCGKDSISNEIYIKEIADPSTFSSKNIDFFKTFDYKTVTEKVFDNLVKKIILATRERMDTIIDEIVQSFV